MNLPKDRALAAEPGANAGSPVLVLRVAADLCEDRVHLRRTSGGATEAANTQNQSAPFAGRALTR